MFRLPRASFYKLCTKIEHSVSDQVFKTERKVCDTTKTEKETDFCGGEISGELQTIVYLGMMVGVSYLDIFMIYDVCRKQVYNSFQKVVCWINNTLSYLFVIALQNKDNAFFEELSEAFSADSGGVYTGCIGTIDGLALRIQRPLVTKELPNPGGYYCRKGSMLSKYKVCVIDKKEYFGCHLDILVAVMIPGPFWIQVCMNC